MRVFAAFWAGIVLISLASAAQAQPDQTTPPQKQAAASSAKIKKPPTHQATSAHKQKVKPSPQTATNHAPSTAHSARGSEVGTASWYGKELQGRRSSNGSSFDSKALVAAHRSLPLNSKARITNLANGKSIEVTVVDRGPFTRDRVIDVSEQAARLLDMKLAGTARVKVDPVGKTSPTNVQVATGE